MKENDSHHTSTAEKNKNEDHEPPTRYKLYLALPFFGGWLPQQLGISNFKLVFKTERNEKLQTKLLELLFDRKNIGYFNVVFLCQCAIF